MHTNVRWAREMTHRHSVSYKSPEGRANCPYTPNAFSREFSTRLNFIDVLIFFLQNFILKEDVKTLFDLYFLDKNLDLLNFS